METELRRLPPNIKRRKCDWVIWAKANWILHYICAILGVVSSCTAATSWSFARVAAVVSAACFGVLGFVRPFRTYHQFMSAARLLDHACLKYEHNLIGIEALLDACASAEKLIQSMDAEELKYVKAPTHAQQKHQSDRE